MVDPMPIDDEFFDQSSDSDNEKTPHKLSGPAFTKELAQQRKNDKQSAQVDFTKFTMSVNARNKDSTHATTAELNALAQAIYSKITSYT